MSTIIKAGLIVEDIDDTSRWMTSILNKAYPSIDIRCASTVQQALDILDDFTPDLALIDLGLPDGSGVDVIHKISSSDSSTIAIVTTVFDDDANVFSALRAGAKGYILKDTESDDFLRLLQGIIEGKPPLSPSIARRLLASFKAPSSDEITSTDLTNREEEILTLIAKGYTVTKSASLLGITYNTASGYVKSVYSKLKISSRAEATLAANQRGLVSTRAN